MAMVKTGTLPHYLYSSKINEVAKTTEAYSPDKVRPSDVEKEVSEVESTEAEQADQFDSASEEEDDSLQGSTNAASLDEGSFFCRSFVEIQDQSSSTKINSRLLS